ncbi:MAG: carboxylesterase family protein [Acidimicrobiales bacterium]
MAGSIAGLLHRRTAGPQPAAETVRRIGQGEVIGLVAENGAHVWRGLPFAASTAGANRWRSPQPASVWLGRREAIEFAPRCAQLTNQGDTDEGLEPGVVIGSEDCLALDIYAPADAKGKALPVMVWIHGGGNVWGRSSLYDGSHLAVNEDVIVVAVQFRVGLLGWFSHPGLRENAEGPDDGAACFATLDLIASLRWIADNIAVFGGDPGCVTIFGESSGGHNVATLLASPLAAGLFHRAIIESGSFDSVSVAEAEGAEGQLINPSTEIAKRLGAETAEALRAVSVEELYAACEIGDGWFIDVPRVIQDGVVLPSTPLREAFASTETFNAVPVVTGTNRDEMKLFYMGDDEMTKKRLGILLVPRDEDFYNAMAEYVSRVWRIRSVDEPASAMVEAGHDSVYSYRFDWDDGGRLLFMDFGQLLGAAHGLEIPFVFNKFEHLGDADRFLFTRGTREDREALSRAIGRYWASFARDGKPSHPGRGDWPPYGTDGGTFLCLDTDNDGGIRPIADVDTVDRLATNLRGDPRLDADRRREIVDEMSKWMFTRPIQAKLQSAIDDAQPPSRSSKNGAIFYSTKYGSTAQYATWISEASGLPAFSTTDPAGDPTDYDFLVLGSPVMHYKLSIRKWVRANAAHVRTKPTVLFTVSGAPSGLKLDGWVADSLPNSLVSRMQHVALRGRWRREDLTRWDRMTLLMAAAVNRDPQARKEELEGFDYMERSSITPIVQMIETLSSTTTTTTETQRSGPGGGASQHGAEVN